jgi:hypothetical protein
MDRRKITCGARRVYGSGAFKERKRLRKDGSIALYWEGYVYASDGKKVFGSGPTARNAEMKAHTNRNKYEKTLIHAARMLVSADAASRSTLLLRDAIDRYIARQAYEYNTLRKYRGFANAIDSARYYTKLVGEKQATLGTLPIADVTVDDLQDFIRGYRSAWTENSTYNIQVFIRQVFRHATKHKWTPENPSADLGRRAKRPRMHHPMPSEAMNRLVDVCEHPQLKAFLLLSTYALRAGEIAALTADSIVEERTLLVTHTQAWMENDLRETDPTLPATTLGLADPKSVYATRPIEIHPDDWWIIERSLSEALEDSVLTYDEGRVSKRFVVSNAHGGQWRTDHIRRALRRFLDSLDDAQLKHRGARLPHTWRVSVITNLIDGEDEQSPGESLAKVSRFAGHARTEITGNVYYKSTKKAQLELARKIGKNRHRTPRPRPEANS